MSSEESEGYGKASKAKWKRTREEREYTAKVAANLREIGIDMQKFPGKAAGLIMTSDARQEVVPFSAFARLRSSLDSQHFVELRDGTEYSCTSGVYHGYLTWLEEHSL